MKKNSNLIGIFQPNLSEIKEDERSKKKKSFFEVYYPGVSIFFNESKARFEQWNLPRRFGLFGQRGCDILVSKGHFLGDQTLTFIICICAPMETQHVIDEALRETVSEIRLKFGRSRFIIGGNFANCDINEFFRTNVDFKVIPMDSSPKEVLITNAAELFQKKIICQGPLISESSREFSLSDNDVILGSLEVQQQFPNYEDIEDPVNVEDDYNSEISGNYKMVMTKPSLLPTLM